MTRISSFRWTKKGHLDVDEWLAQEFMFQIPTVLLCSADCRGYAPGAARRGRNVPARRRKTKPLLLTQGSQSSNHC